MCGSVSRLSPDGDLGTYPSAVDIEGTWRTIVDRALFSLVDWRHWTASMGQETVDERLS